MKTSIIIPTFNEKENIEPLFDNIFNVFNKHDIDGELIIVDDDSDDGTADLVRGLSDRYNVKLIVRKNEKGLASACIKGFEQASGDIFIVMDADLQHPPEKIPELIDSIEKGADIAIGSRYVDGGSLGDWPVSRKIISKGASGIANILFKEIKDVKDKQSGFFGFKKDVIDNVELKPKGYKILLEILVLGNYKEINEVGYRFGLRKSGESKLKSKIIFSYLLHLMSLFKKSGKLLKLFKILFVVILLLIIFAVVVSVI